MIIYGASGHGKVIHDILKSQRISEDILFVDDADKGDLFYGCKLLKPQQVNLSEHKIIIGIGNNLIRKKISYKYPQYALAIHASSVISPSVEINEGSVVMSNVSINADTKIGKHCILNTACSIDHDCVLDDFVHISPNASLAGNVKVGEATHIGIGACVIQGIKIGKFATVGAGSVVIKDVPDGATVVGSPAKIIKT
ncbi:acetyltransferase [Weeksellaceae bacterium KMM 9724]|uniref:acetyltransferase n=1 Tax=Profundicola chukchiensis TaxID=2961959 RepID=UPI00243C31BE|nr:acetyltransferase [Profundicola chukchiensis]MDG4949859.1 acetyltransferase [Profundicola chukchiensis]